MASCFGVIDYLDFLLMLSTLRVLCLLALWFIWGIGCFGLGLMFCCLGLSFVGVVWFICCFVCLFVDFGVDVVLLV